MGALSKNAKFGNFAKKAMNTALSLVLVVGTTMTCLLTAKPEQAYAAGTPNFTISKTVSTQSAASNSDYTRGKEFRVGNTITYKVVVENTATGTTGENVTVIDNMNPEGFTRVGDIQVEGLENSAMVDGQHVNLSYNMRNEKNPNGSWGWSIAFNYLPANMPITITYSVMASDETNGWEVSSHASVKADNATALKDSAEAVVWINTPEFNLDKRALTTDESYQVGGTARYNVTMYGLKTPGTLARHTTLEDAFKTEGTTINENSFVIVDKPSQAVPIKGVDLHRSVGDQFWSINMDEVYSDNGYWTSEEDFYYQFKDGELTTINGHSNPAEVTGHTYFLVDYSATINNNATENELVVNEAKANSNENFPVIDQGNISVVGAMLTIDKTSTDDGNFTAGDSAKYSITIQNKGTATTARDIQVSDRFTTAKAGACYIVDGSVKIVDNQGYEVKDFTVNWVDNEANHHIGFTIDTNTDLNSNNKLVVTYDVKYLTNNGSSVLQNNATVWAANAPEAATVYETWPADVDQSILTIDKGSDKQWYGSNSTAQYTLYVTNNSDSTVANNVSITDAITKDTLDIARVVKGSVQAYDERGGVVSCDVVYDQGDNGLIRGFTANTNDTLAPDESIKVVYLVAFDKVSQETSVHNEAYATGDNTGRAEDELDVIVSPNVDPGDGDGDGSGSGGDGGTNIPTNAALAIEKSSNKSFYTPADTANYTLVVTNNGQTTARNVTISDELDDSESNIASIVKGSVNLRNAMGGTVSFNDIGYTYNDNGDIVGFNIRTNYNLVYGDNITVTYDVKYSDSVDEKMDVYNKATAVADNAPSAMTDNTVTVDVVGHPDLSLKLTSSPETVSEGGNIIYTMALDQLTENLTAKNVSATVELPEGFTLDEGTVRVIVGGDESNITPVISSNQMTFNFGDITYENEITVTYSGTVSDTFDGTSLVTKATAKGDNVEKSVEASNTVKVSSSARSELEVTKTADVDEASKGDTVTWTIDANVGNEDVKEFVLTDTLPAGVELDEKSTEVLVNGEEIIVAPKVDKDNVMTLELGTVKAKSTVQFNYDTKLGDADKNGQWTNVVEAEGANVKAVEAEAVVSTPPADIVLEKTADRLIAQAGDTVTWTIKATLGTNDLTTLLVSDPIPSNMTYVQGSMALKVDGEFVTDIQPTVSETGIVSLMIDEAAAGSEYTMTFKTTLNEDASGIWSNTAYAQADGVDTISSLAAVATPEQAQQAIQMMTQGNTIAKTGDVVLGWFATYWPVLLVGAALAIASCVAVRRKLN